MLILGQGALARPDGAARARARRQGRGSRSACVEDGWNGFKVLHTAAARVGGLDLGFVPGDGRPRRRRHGRRRRAGDVARPSARRRRDRHRALGRAFVVYQGTHGDRGAHRADVILPGAAYTEKDGLYVNTEGRVQLAERAVFPPGEAREDWAILRALSDVLGQQLPFDIADAACARLFAGASASCRHRRDRAAAARAPRDDRGERRRPSAGERALRLPDRGLLSDQPDRARLARRWRNAPRPARWRSRTQAAE